MLYVQFFFVIAIAIPLLAFTFLLFGYPTTATPLCSYLGKEYFPCVTYVGSMIPRSIHSLRQTVHIPRQVYAVHANEQHDQYKEQLRVLQDFIYNCTLNCFFQQLMDQVWTGCPGEARRGSKRAPLQGYPYGHKNRRGDVIKKM